MSHLWNIDTFIGAIAVIALVIAVYTYRQLSDRPWR